MAGNHVDAGEAYLRGALDRIGDGFFTVDRDWRYTYLNRSTEDYLGRRRDELLGRVMWEVFPETVGTDVERLYREAAAGTAPVERELFGPLRKRWVAVRVFPSSDGIAVSFRDVTDRKLAEDALRDSEARYRSLFENSLDAIFLTAPDGEILAANPAGCRMLLRTEDEIRAVGRAGVVDGTDPRAQAYLEERSRTGRARGELTMVRGDGTRFPALVSSAVFVDRMGRERTSMSVHDLSARKRDEEALFLLTEAGRLLPSSLDSDVTIGNLAQLVVPGFAAVFVIDRVDDAGIERIVEAGGFPDRHRRRRFRLPDLAGPRPRGASRVLHSGQPELVTDVTDDWLRDAAEDDTQLAAARSLGLRSAIVVPMVSRGVTIGVLSFLRGAPQPRYIEADLPVALGLADRMALALDNARLYAAAVAARQRRDEMLGVVSHDLRSPLNAIAINAQLLERRAPSRAVTAIRRAVDRADRLVQDLLAISAIESGRLPLERELLPVAAILEEVVELHRPIAGESAIALELCDETKHAVSVDRHRLVQALSNLLGNAIKFAPERSTITLRARTAGGGVEIDVADQGPGIAADELPHLFDRFWQARPTPRGGVGLGLAIAKGIVEAHGGTLRVASAPGEGATFTIALPPA